MAKVRKPVFWDLETWRALEEYARRHPELTRGPRATTPSQAAEHLVTRALYGGLGDGIEEMFRRVVCEEVRRLADQLDGRPRAG